jgi:hypothetical protein
MEQQIYYFEVYQIFFALIAPSLFLLLKINEIELLYQTDTKKGLSIDSG